MHKQLTTTHGTIAYQDVGDGLPLIFVHGLFSNANTWRKVIEPLSRYFRCIVPTLPLGAHEIPVNAGQPFTGDTVSQILKQLADALGLEQFVLIGNDTGGAYAQIFTSQYPDRVSHLILTNCDAFEVFPPQSFASLQTLIKVPLITEIMGLLFRSKRFAQSKFVLGALSLTLDGATIQRLYLHHFIHNAAIRRDCKQVILGWNTQDTLKAADKLRHFTRPVLVMWGLDDHDLFPLELGHRVAGIFSDVTFRTVEQSSTYVQEDNPQAFIQHVSEFLAGEMREGAETVSEIEAI